MTEETFISIWQSKFWWVPWLAAILMAIAVIADSGRMLKEWMEHFYRKERK